jgi:hypothetical protein
MNVRARRMNAYTGSRASLSASLSLSRSLALSVRAHVCWGGGLCKRSSTSPGCENNASAPILHRAGTKILLLADSTSLAAARRRLSKPTA